MIKTEKYVRKSLMQGVDELANIVKTTLGPHGRTVILQSPEEGYYTTKDGISVARHVHSTDTSIDAVIQIVREATAKTAEIAGDGTTTSTILVQSLVKYCIDHIEAGVSPLSLKKGMNNALDCFKSLLSSGKYSTKVKFDYKTLKDIATISANNDSELGDIIASAFIKVGEEGLVLFDMSTRDYTYVDTIEGMQINSNLLTPAFINNHRSQTAEFEEKDNTPVGVLLINGEVNKLQNIATTLNSAIQRQMPILIAAWDFSYNVIREILQNNLRNNTMILPIKAEGFGDNKLECLKDISVITNATIFDNENSTNYSGIGICKKVIVSAFNTTIVKSDDVSINSLSSRVDMIKGRIDATTDIDTKKRLQEKLAKLTGKMAIIHVGGATESIAKEKYDRIEDAVYATKAAIEEGISLGGGITLLNIANELCKIKITEHREGFNNAIKALYTPFNQLCINSNIQTQKKFNKGEGINFLTGEVVNMTEAGIIDPTKVLRVAFENAVSIASLIITTSGIITND